MILNGPYYDDKIVERIDGFTQGLDYVNIEYELLKEETINENHEMYILCGFEYL